jgi:hypothetical protein
MEQKQRRSWLFGGPVPVQNIGSAYGSQLSHSGIITLTKQNWKGIIFSRGKKMAEGTRELFSKINNDLQAAMKQKNELRLSVLRMMKSKILYVNARGDLPDAEIIKILTKYAKDIKESIEEFKKVGREQAAERCALELAITQEYLPPQLSAAEIKSLVERVAAELGATSIKEMGNLMKAVMDRNPGIDAKLVNQLAREILK